MTVTVPVEEPSGLYGRVKKTPCSSMVFVDAACAIEVNNSSDAVPSKAMWLNALYSLAIDGGAVGENPM